DPVYARGQPLGSATGLPRSGVNNVGGPVLMLAGFENGEWGQRIHVQIRKWILHRLDVAHVSCEIENIFFVAHELADQREIGGVAFDDLDIVPNTFNVEVIRAACWMKGIDDGDGGATFDKTYGEIASNEAEAAGN